MIQYLPTVNASLNATATVLLLVGRWLIKHRQETAHKWFMMSSFGVSMLFLACYLAYHAMKTWHTAFGGPQPMRAVYHAILISHVLLAATVPILAGRTMYLGLCDRRAEHRRWARWTYPIWLYVSITGVVIYFMLYHLYPPSKTDDTIPAVATVAAENYR